MQVDSLREQQRDQHIAVQRLNHAVDHHQINELVAPAPLEQRDQCHRHCHHHCAHIWHDHRNTHQHGQQRRIVEAQRHEAYVGHAAADKDLDDLAANVIGDLAIHFFRHPGHQRTLSRQIAHDPATDETTILEEEKHQDRHQHQIDHDVGQQRQARQRERQRPLAEFADLAPRRFDRVQHLLIRDQMRVTLRQQKQQRLPFGQHPRQLVEQRDQLMPEQWHQDQQKH